MKSVRMVAQPNPKKMVLAMGAQISDFPPRPIIMGKTPDKFSDIIFQFQCSAAGSAIGTNVNQGLAVADFQAPAVVCCVVAMVLN